MYLKTIGLSLAVPEIRIEEAENKTALLLLLELAPIVLQMMLGIAGRFISALGYITSLPHISSSLQYCVPMQTVRKRSTAFFTYTRSFDDFYRANRH